MSNIVGFSDFTRQELEAYLSLNPSVCFKWQNDSSRTILHACPNVTSLLGYTQEQMLSKNYVSLIHPEDVDHILQEFMHLKKSEKSTYKPYRLRKLDGKYLWVEEISICVKEGYILGTITDISSFVTSTKGLSKITAFLESYKIALDESSIVSKSDVHGKITYGNKNFQNITGHTKDELIGKSHNINRHPDTPKETFRIMWETIQAKKVWKGILKNRKKDGTPYWVDMTILPILDENGEIIEYIGVRHDITTIIEQRETITRQAFTHMLTGLPNRQKLIKDLKEKHITALALVDVDKFSQINDLYGYKNGDNILIKLAHEIDIYLKDFSDFTLYHLNADEFVLTIDQTSKKEFADLIKNLLERIDRLEVSFDDIHVMLDLSCGISFESPDKLLQTATMAMRHSRIIKENTAIYNENLNKYKEYENNIFWSSKLHIALLNDNITPYFQPIINNATQKWEKYEALVRLVENDTAHSPFHFLEIAKQTKQYKSITRAVVRKSFDVFKERKCTISVNLSKYDIVDSSTRKFLIDSIKEANIGNRLVIEIVESEGIENFKEITTFINEIKTLGCQIAIDDFGTGYSNFAYLLQLNPDFIKIDGSMIRNLTTDKNSYIIVQTIVNFAKSIGIKTVAEFVKDKATFEAVKAMGIDYSQGYFFSEPLANLPSTKTIKIDAT